MFRRSRLFLPCCIVILLAVAGSKICAAATTLRIPRVNGAPKIEDFEDMTPHGAASELQRVTDFRQNQPSDGQPGTDRTEGFIGYDPLNLYVILVC